MNICIFKLKNNANNILNCCVLRFVHLCPSLLALGVQSNQALRVAPWDLLNLVYRLHPKKKKKNTVKDLQGHALFTADSFTFSPQTSTFHTILIQLTICITITVDGPCLLSVQLDQEAR